jgi:hypothetical protein
MANEAATARTFVTQVLENCRGVEHMNFYAVLGSACRDGTLEILRRLSFEEPRLRVVWAPDCGIHSRAHFFQTEIKYYCRNLRIKEVPITDKTDAAGVGHRALLDAVKNLGRLIRLRWFGTGQ